MWRDVKELRGFPRNRCAPLAAQPKGLRHIFICGSGILTKHL